MNVSMLNVAVQLAVMAVLVMTAGVVLLRAFGLGAAVRMSRDFCRRSVMARIVPLCFTAGMIAYGSSKPSTNQPPRSAVSAPRRRNVVVAGEPWRCGTNEVWCFDCPVWGTKVTPWACRGAYEDWITCGELGVLIANGRVITDRGSYEIYDSPLSVAPETTPVGDGATSCVWFGRAPWGSAVYTWQNACVCRDSSNVVSAQLELLPNGGRIFRYGGVSGMTSRAYLPPRPPDADSDGDGIPDCEDAAFMDPDSDGDGIVDGMSRSEYRLHPLWRANSTDGEPMDVRLNEPVVPPASAVLRIGTLRILLTTNAVYRLNLEDGVEYGVELFSNGYQPVNLSAERGED